MAEIGKEEKIEFIPVRTINPLLQHQTKSLEAPLTFLVKA
jgi:hypothetical protein